MMQVSFRKYRCMVRVLIDGVSALKRIWPWRVIRSAIVRAFGGESGKVGATPMDDW